MSVNQSVMKTMSTPNFMRSANAPTVRAGVMIAKVIWKVAKTDSGMVPMTDCAVMPAMNALPSPPTNVPGVSNARL